MFPIDSGQFLQPGVSYLVEHVTITGMYMITELLYSEKQAINAPKRYYGTIFNVPSTVEVIQLSIQESAVLRYSYCQAWDTGKINLNMYNGWYIFDGKTHTTMSNKIMEKGYIAAYQVFIRPGLKYTGIAPEHVEVGADIVKLPGTQISLVVAEDEFNSDKDEHSQKLLVPINYTEGNHSYNNDIMAIYSQKKVLHKAYNIYNSGMALLFKPQKSSVTINVCQISGKSDILMVPAFKYFAGIPAYPAFTRESFIQVFNGIAVANNNEVTYNKARLGQVVAERTKAPSRRGS